MNSMPVRFGGKTVEIFGGPYFDRPAEMFGIKLAAEINSPCDIDLPIRDYSVPSIRQTKQACLQCIKAMGRGEQIYAGCWGGKGRTGLFLAIMAKVAGVQDPVAYVRSSFNVHAVETEEQQQFVENFPIFWLRWAYRATGAANAVKPTKGLSMK